MPRLTIVRVGTTNSKFKIPKMLDFQISWSDELVMNNILSRPFILSVRNATTSDTPEWQEVGNYFSPTGAQKDIDELVGFELSTDRWVPDED